MTARAPRVVAVLALIAIVATAAVLVGAGVVRPCADRPDDPTCVALGRSGASPSLDPADAGQVGPDGQPLPSIEALPSGAGPSPTPLATPDWTRYTFHDEFDGSALDPKWGRHWGSLGLSELSRIQTSVGNGVLSITAARVGGVWQSDLVDSFDSFRQRYGIFEARIRIPQGRGLWPAFWLADDWASSRAEFDIAEICANPPGTNRANDVTVLHQIIHGVNVYRVGAKALRTGDLSTDWHTYGLEWRPDHVSFFFDGVETWRYTGGQIPEMPMTVILSLEVGSWCGQPNATTPSPAVMQVDWVRVQA